MKNYLIAPSILAADFARLGEEVAAVLQAGADMIHIDVMDNHYVPNLSMGPQVLHALRNYGITQPLDVHLMIKPVDSIIPVFAKAGATYISFHPEATEHIHRTLQIIHDHGCQTGIVLNPGTPVNVIEPIIDEIDLILVMSVNPGFGGQEFIASSLKKLQTIRKMLQGTKIRLEVDGGVNMQNIHAIAKAGADIFVMGSAIFNTQDYQDTINEMRREIEKSG